MSLETTPVGVIASASEGARALLRGHGIDADREAARPLAEAAARCGADLSVITRQLEMITPQSPPPPDDPEALIALILKRYHEVHRRDFPEAIRLARQEAAAQGDDPRGARDLADHLSIMFDELEGHQLKEERMLFPMMLAGGRQMVGLPLARMLAEHDAVVRQLEQLSDLTHQFTPPETASPSLCTLYELCRTIDGDLREHMHLENDVLFPLYGGVKRRP